VVSEERAAFTANGGSGAPGTGEATGLFVIVHLVAGALAYFVLRVGVVGGVAEAVATTGFP
jgi:hypothetical protein